MLYKCSPVTILLYAVLGVARYFVTLYFFTVIECNSLTLLILLILATCNVSAFIDKVHSRAWINE